MAENSPNTPGDDSDPDKTGSNGPGPNDPFADMLGQMFGGGAGAVPPGMPAGFDLSALASQFPGGEAGFAQMMEQVQRIMASSSDEPVNWELALDTARRTAATQPDPVPSDADGRAARDALTVADAWLDGACTMTTTPGVLQSWSKAEWIESTLPVWQNLAGPVAVAVADAMEKAMSSQIPPEMAPMMANASGMLRQVGGGVFGAQVGQAVGSLAGEVMTSYDIGVPLTDDGDMALIPHNVAAFSEGLEIPDYDIRLYMALREAAHHRLYGNATWLRSHVFEAVQTYAQGITIDTDRIEQAIAGVDPTNPEALQDALGDGVLQPEATPQQKAALERLELLLALIEGWVDHVVSVAADGRMESAGALRETMRRRRAAGGPAEHTLATLVGLQLRPRRARDAAALWQLLFDADGAEGRDGVWTHPDLLPQLADLDDPEQALRRMQDRIADAADGDLDAELRTLLAEEGGDAAGGTA